MAVGDERTSNAEYVLREGAPGRKGAILAAAADVFSERGYDGGSMREIAARVGVTEPALYRHYPGKEALFLALLRTVASRVRDEALLLIDGVDAASLRDQLHEAFRNRRRAVRLYAPVLRTILSTMAFNPKFLDEFRSTMVEPVRAHLLAKAAEIDEALHVGAAEDTRAERVRALMALFVGYFASSMVLGDEADDAITDAALRVMRWG